MYAICPKNLRFLVKKAKFTKLNFSQGGSAEISLILDSTQPNRILTGTIFAFLRSFQKDKRGKRSKERGKLKKWGKNWKNGGKSMVTGGIKNKFNERKRE